MRCNAKITTAEVTDEVVSTLCSESDPSPAAHFHLGAVPDGGTVQVRGDRLVRVDLHPLECSDAEPGHIYDHWCAEADISGWTDDTRGATPHTDDVTVTDAEVEAAMGWLYEQESWTPGHRSTVRHYVEGTLLAAKRAEKERS